MKVKRYVGDRAAVITTSGKRVLVSSLLPLRSGAGAGKAKRPIDTRLESDRGRLRPAQPLSDFSLALRAASGSLINFPRSDVKFTLDGTRNARGIRSGKSLIYPNAFPDADAILKSLPASVGFAVSLRGPRAPQNYPVSLTLRPGDRLLSTGPRARGAQRGPTGGAVVLRSGRAVSTISAPMAVDAAGTPLPVRTLISGDRLVYRLAHRNRKTDYPALLDPFVSEDQRYWFGAPPGPTPPSPNPIPDFNGWSYNVTGVGGLAGAQGNGAFGNGLNIFASNALTYPPSGTIGTWTFQAPFNPAFEADGARIVKADFGYTAHVRSQGATSTMLQSIYNRQAGRTENGFVRGSDPNGSYTAYPNTLFGFSQAASEGIAGNKATYPYRVHCLSVCNTAVPAGNLGLGSPGNQVRLGLLQNGGRPSVAGGVFMGSSLIMMTEQAAPRITTTGAPSAATWTNAPFTINATVNDYGLGPNDASITAPNNTAPLPTVTQGGACTAGAGPTVGGTPGSANKGDRNHRCTAPLSLQAPSSSLADGSYNISVNATDILGTSGSATLPVMLDRQPPTLALSGSLYDARDKFIGPNQNYSLSVTATDGATSPATAQRSGVTSLIATLDGQPLTNGTASVPCTRPEGSCPLTINPTLTGEQIDNLDDTVPHTVSIVATDALGQASSPASFTFKVDKTAPTVSLGGQLSLLQERVLTEDSYELIFDALDNADEIHDPNDDDETQIPDIDALPRSGIKDTIVRLDGASVPTTAASCLDGYTCDEARSWTWNSAQTPNGTHEITVTVTDNVGNETVEAFEVDLQRAADQPPRTNAVLRTIKGAAASDRAGASVAAIGDVDNDGRADHLVGAPGVGSSAGAAYVVLGNGGSVVDLAASNPSVRRILGPTANAYCGTSVAALGDVNGDDIDDFAIGCPGQDSNAIGSLTPTVGRVFVIFGRTNPQALNLGTLGDAGFQITGPQDPGHLGVPLVTSRAPAFGERLQSEPVGSSYSTDVNGDGLSDVVVGDAQATNFGASQAGSAYVVFGKIDSSEVRVNDFGSGGFVIRGTTARGLTGHAAVIVNDVDGDRLADILVGSPGAGIPSALNPGVAGRAHVVYGKSAPAPVDLGASADTHVTLTNGITGDRFGASVAALGDTDLDGQDDIAIGTNSAAYVLRRVPSSTGPVTASNGYRVTGPANDPGLLGVRVPSVTLASAGDLDGDERDDIAVGYPDSASAAAFSIRSPQGSRTIDVASLPGQRGSANRPTGTTARPGAGLAANTFQGYAPVSENAQVIVGAPELAKSVLEPAAGSAYVLSEPVPQGPGTIDDQIEVEASSSAGATARALSPRRYYLDGPFRTWRSVRTARGQIIMGLVPGGHPSGEPFTSGSYVDVAARLGSSYYGNVRSTRSAFRGCGWVLVSDTNENPSTPLAGRSKCSTRRQDKFISLGKIASLIDCDLCGSAATVSLRKGVDSTGRPMPATIRMFRNAITDKKKKKEIGANPVPEPGEPLTDLQPTRLRSTVLDEDGDPTDVPTRVRWRYVTKNKNMVLVTVLGLPGSRNAFIERKYLPPDTSPTLDPTGRSIGLCGTLTDESTEDRPAPPLKDNRIGNLSVPLTPITMDMVKKPPLIPAKGKRLKRTGWPPVCQTWPYTAGKIE